MANGHKRPPAALIVLVVIALLAGGGYLWWRLAQDGAPTSLALSGTVESTEYQVASALAGRIVSVEAEEGVEVAEGDVLVKLDDTAQKLQVEQAEQSVKAAKAKLARARDTGTSTDVAVAKTVVKQAEAAVGLAKLQLNYTVVKAPHAGVVVAVAANAGENAGPGKTLITLADDADLFVRVYLPEPRMGELKVGDGVTIASDGKTFPGTVSFISSQAEFTPNTVETEEQRGNLVYEVRVRVTGSAGALKAGLPVTVERAQ